MFNKFSITSSKKSAVVQTVKSDFATIVYVDPDESVFHFGYMTSGNISSFGHEKVAFRTRLYDEEFFRKLSEALNSYNTKHPSAQNATATVVLPDMSVSTNVLSIPTMKKNKSAQSFDVVLKDMYKNREELKINKSLMVTNKQFTTYALAMVNQQVLTNFYAIFATSKMTPRSVTYAANATVNAFAMLNSKVKSDSYIFMDIKHGFTRICFVDSGRTAGFYSLPFGYSVLHKNRLAAEDMLFDEPNAELLVLNAMEKAKAKQLTMRESDMATQTAHALEDMAAEEEEPAEDAETEEEDEPDTFYASTIAKSPNPSIKVLPKKMPRKLPKYMLRPLPVKDVEYIYENFRIFEKWVLNLAEQNKSLFSAPPKCIYVNMPEDYDFLFEKVNEEVAENRIKFVSADMGGVDKAVRENLEVYGGFIENTLNDTNEF